MQINTATKDSKKGPPPALWRQCGAPAAGIVLHCSQSHCWKVLLILVLGKVASKTQYSHFVICKVWVLGFTHHFTLHPLIWQIFSLISWLYFSTMWILWGRKCDYWVFHITHAKKGLPNHSSSTRDLKDFFSICDVENSILTYPPHSILSIQFRHNKKLLRAKYFWCY